MGVPVALVLQYGQAVLQGHQRFGAFTAVLVVPQVLMAAGIAALYVSGTGGLVPVMWVTTLAAIGGAVLALLLVRKTVQRVPPEHQQPTRRQIRAFARRSYFGQLAPVESLRLDQLAVAAALSPAVLGYYGVATAFTNLSRFLGTSMGFVLAPYIASLPAEQQRRSLVRGLGLTVAVCALATLALFPATGFLVPLLFGDAFRPAIPLAQILLVAGLLLGVRRALLPGLRGLGLPGIGSYSELVALLVFAVLLPFALQSTTGIGVAIAFLVSAVAAIVLLAVLCYVSITGTSGGQLADPQPASDPADPALPLV
jgi:O-antigen/teichoic acid export membrane protein